MNYYLYCLRRFARLILLLWIVFRIAPLAAQDRAARLDFQVRKATLDTFVRQLEDSTGFSFIYGEKVQLRQPVTLDVRQKTIEEILQYAFGWKRPSRTPISFIRSPGRRSRRWKSAPSCM